MALCAIMLITYKGCNVMETKMIRVRIPLELFMKYKVFCAMLDKSMTEQTEHIVREFIKENSENVKIIKIERKDKK